MSGQLFQMVAKRALKDTARKNINSKDPYFEEVAVYGRDGRATGKVKKQKKGIPVGLSPNDGKVLKRVRKQAYRLDMSLFNCCGIRFGWSSVIGIVPVVGDVIDLFMAWLVVKACSKVDGGLPPAIQYRMYFNIVLDFGLGLVPFIGDVADAVFRANTRNAWILEEYLVKKVEAGQIMEQEKRRTGRSQLPPNYLSDSGPDGQAPSFGPGVGSYPATTGTATAGAAAGATNSGNNSVQPPKKSFWSRGRDSGLDHQYDQEMGVVDGSQHGHANNSGRK